MFELRNTDEQLSPKDLAKKLESQPKKRIIKIGTEQTYIIVSPFISEQQQYYWKFDFIFENKTHGEADQPVEFIRKAQVLVDSLQKLSDFCDSISETPDYIIWATNTQLIINAFKTIQALPDYQGIVSFREATETVIKIDFGNVDIGEKIEKMKDLFNFLAINLHDRVNKIKERRNF